MTEENTPTEGENGFEPITSQEALNKVIGQRIAKVESRFADYDDLKSKAEKFDEAQQAAKSDLEKALERAEQAEKRAATYEAKEQVAKWAAEIVGDSGVPAEALRGSTREELEEHFGLLKPHFTKPAPTRTATPKGKPASGSGESRAVAALRELRGTA